MNISCLIRCSVGAVFHLIYGIIAFFIRGLTGIFSACIWEVIKFGIVLTLAYMLALSIFFLWENKIPCINCIPEIAMRLSDAAAGTSPVPLTPLPAGRGSATASAQQEGSFTKYPFVVEIPSKTSADSLKKAKAKEKRDSKQLTEENSPEQVLLNENEEEN